MYTQATVTEYVPVRFMDRTFVLISPIRTNAPWGLSRISQAGPTGGSASGTSFSYRYDSSAGSGVDIYIVGLYLIQCLLSMSFSH